MTEVQVFEGDGVKPPGWEMAELKALHAAAVEETKKVSKIINACYPSKPSVEYLREMAVIEHFLKRVLTESDQALIAYDMGSVMGTAVKLWKEGEAPRVALEKCKDLWERFWNNNNPRAYITSTES